MNILDGPDALHHRMVGSDVWLLDKKNPVPPKGLVVAKKTKGGKKGAQDSIDEPAAKRRRQTWLGEYVGAAVRRMRKSFFKCSLASDLATDKQIPLKSQLFNEYAESFNADGDSKLFSARVADARHALLEFSQFRSLEFDTLRRAKYSSSMLLYHLHNEGAPGLIPKCSSCCQEIEGVRWHRINKVVERRAVAAVPTSGRKPKVMANVSFEPEELCSTCFSKIDYQDQFIPLQVSV